jgi:hypothetical protein
MFGILSRWSAPSRWSLFRAALHVVTVHVEHPREPGRLEPDRRGARRGARLPVRSARTRAIVARPAASTTWNAPDVTLDACTRGQLRGEPLALDDVRGGHTARISEREEGERRRRTGPRRKTRTVAPLAPPLGEAGVLANLKRIASESTETPHMACLGPCSSFFLHT